MQVGSREIRGNSKLGEERGLEDECEGVWSIEEIFMAGEQDGGGEWW